MLSLKKTTDQLIYEKTCQDEFESFAANIDEERTQLTTGEKSIRAFPKFAMNRLVYSLTFNEKINKLLTKFHDHKFGGNVLGYREDIEMKKYIDIATIGDHTFTFKEAMAVIRQMREAVGPEVFYGATIANYSHNDVNPLHPLILNEFMAMTDEKLGEYRLKNYSVNIYTFKDTWNQIKEEYPKKFTVKNEYTEDILDLIMGTKFKRDTFSIRLDPILKEENGKFKILYRESAVDKDGNEIKLPTETDYDKKYKQGYVIPGQIINLNGLAYPYYGAIYVKGGKAWNLSPMWATNINNPQDNGPGSVKKGSDICTKVGDVRTARGCMTLNHSNTESQRNPYTFTDGAMGYAQVAVDIALSMYFNDYDGTIQLSPKDKKMTLKEFLKATPDGTKKDYLIYIRDRMKERMN